jgi:hypothetical protein
MKDKILKLRSLGMSYNNISKTLGCSKSIVNYYCSESGKKNLLDRNQKYRLNKIEHRKKQFQKLRELVWRHKKLCGCVLCSNKDPRVLDYDHLDSSNKQEDISRMINRGNSIKTLKNEIRKCRILCANCHRIKTFEDRGYWIHKPG